MAKRRAAKKTHEAPEATFEVGDPVRITGRVLQVLPYADHVNLVVELDGCAARVQIDASSDHVEAADEDEKGE